MNKYFYLLVLAPFFVSCVPGKASVAVKSSDVAKDASVPRLRP